nr:MAG TPA: hypothetical protein [Caudoviricetes sp.]
MISFAEKASPAAAASFKKLSLNFLTTASV